MWISWFQSQVISWFQSLLPQMQLVPLQLGQQGMDNFVANMMQGAQRDDEDGEEDDAAGAGAIHNLPAAAWGGGRGGWGAILFFARGLFKNLTFSLWEELFVCDGVCFFSFLRRALFLAGIYYIDETLPTFSL
jgi:hypothetical protein